MGNLTFNIYNSNASTLKGLTIKPNGTRVTEPVDVSPNSLVRNNMGPDSEIAKTIAGVVRTRSGDRCGTGVVLRDDGLILTASHVIKKDEDLKVCFPLYEDSLFLEYETKEGELLSFDKGNDLALLRTKGSIPENCSGLRISSHAPGQFIYSLGYTSLTTKRVGFITLHNTEALLLFPGEVISHNYDEKHLHKIHRLTGNFLRESFNVFPDISSDVGVKHLTAAYLTLLTSRNDKRVSKLATSAHLFSGNSGGPVLNENRELIGIHHCEASSFGRGEIRVLGLKEPELDFTGISFSANSTQILDFLSRTKVPLKDIAF